MKRVESLEVRAVRPDDADALVQLFAETGVACHCRYWHFRGDTNSWLDRCANHLPENREELRGAVASDAPEMWGAVAATAEGIVGWIKVTPAERVDKLYGHRLYRNLPCFQGLRDGTFTVGCLLVHPEWRRQGVARRLIGGAVRASRERGARQIEAFPRRAEAVADAELFTGPYSAFIAEGFEVVHEFGPYPVLRRSLG